MDSAKIRVSSCIAFIEKVRYRQIGFIAAKGEIREEDDYYVWRVLLQDLMKIKDTDRLSVRETRTKVVLSKLKSWLEARVKEQKIRYLQEAQTRNFLRNSTSAIGKPLPTYPFSPQENSQRASDIKSNVTSEANSPRGCLLLFLFLFVNFCVAYFLWSGAGSVGRASVSSAVPDGPTEGGVTFLSLLPPGVDVQKIKPQEASRRSFGFRTSVHAMSDGQ